MPQRIIPSLGKGKVRGVQGLEHRVGLPMGPSLVAASRLVCVALSLAMGWESWAAGSKTTVALVARSPAAEALAEMTAARAFPQEIAVVERQDLAPLFNELEQAIFTGGSRALPTDIQIAGVEFFAVFSADNTGSGAALIVVDSQAGVRLVDTSLGGTLVDKARTAADLIARAINKQRQIKRRTLRSVSITALRNIDLPHSEANMVTAVGYLLEQQIVNSSDLLLLERRALEWVNRESEIPSETGDPSLESARVTLEIQVGRFAKAGMMAVVLLKDTNSQLLTRIEASTTTNDVSGLAKRLFVEVAEALDAATAKGHPIDAQCEAGRLFREHLFLKGFDQREAALQYIEAAAALDPSLRHPALADYLFSLAEYYLPAQCNDNTAERVERALDLAERATTIRIQVRDRGTDPVDRLDYGDAFAARLAQSTRQSTRPADLVHLMVDFLRRYVNRACERNDVRAARLLQARGNPPIEQLDGKTLTQYRDTIRWMNLRENDWHMFPEWLETRPDQVEQWFRIEAHLTEARPQKGYDQHFLGNAVSDAAHFLRKVVRGEMKVYSNSTRNQARRLLDVYAELDLERKSQMAHPPSIRSPLKFQHEGKQIERKIHSPYSTLTPTGTLFGTNVRRALDWLAERQLDDGSWREELRDQKTELTCLCLLAFLASGEGLPGQKYWGSVSRGLRFLVEDAILADGSVRFGDFFENTQGLVLMTLSEAVRLTGLQDLKEAGILVLDRIHRKMSDPSAILHATRFGPEDICFVWWLGAGLAAAQNAGIEHDGLQSEIDQFAASLRKSFDPDRALFGAYIVPESSIAYTRFNDRGLPHPSCYAMHALQNMGWENCPEALAVRQTLLQIDPSGRSHLRLDDVGKFNSDAVYCLATMAFEHGEKTWQNWKRVFVSRIVAAQKQDGSWSSSIRETAYKTLALTVPRAVLFRHPDPKAPSAFETTNISAQSQDGLAQCLLDKTRIVFALRHGSDVYVGSLATEDLESRHFPPCPLVISRFSLNRVSRDEIASINPRDPRELGLRFSSLEDAQARTALSEEFLFYGLDGVLLIPLVDGSIRRLTKSDGLPSDEVQSLAWMDGSLYLGLGGIDSKSYVVRYELDSGYSKLLFAPGRLGSLNPLESVRSPLRIRGITPDPVRRRILVLVGLGSRTHKEVSGLWEFSLPRNAWRQLHHIGNSCYSRLHRQENGDVLISQSGVYALRFDPETDKIETIWCKPTGHPDEEHLRKGPSLLPPDMPTLFSPFLLTDHWLLVSNPPARICLEDSRMEPIRLNLPQGVVPHLVDTMNQGRHVIIATDASVWIVDQQNHGSREAP